MPLITPIWNARLRQNWPLVGAILVLFVLTISDQVLYRPMVRRYQAALKRATQLGMPLDPNNVPTLIPPRLFALLTNNALPEAVAQEQSNSGALTAQLLSDLTSMMSQHGIQVISTEPGPMTQQNASIQVRAHLRLRCRYGQFIALLDDFARRPSLYSLDRFAYAGDSPGGDMLELWLSRYVIKQTKAHS